MIKNEREYGITKTQFARFERALAEFDESTEANPNVHPSLVALQKDALKVQLGELRAQLQEYEALKSGDYAVPKLTMVQTLPELLVKGRIAAGLSQRQLAERLGLKEQQIQRYEATGYASASLTRIREVAKALGLAERDETLSQSSADFDVVLNGLRELGLSKDFVLERLVPFSLRAYLGQLEKKATGSVAIVTATLGKVLQRVFSLNLEELGADRRLSFDWSRATPAGFKLPAVVNEKRLSAYTIYTYYLVGVTLRATHSLRQKRLPSTAAEFRDAVVKKYAAVTFSTVLRYVWDLGIPVLPLRDSGAFHGACWRKHGRTVLVLKQKTQSNARWLFDLCHEFRHAIDVEGLEEAGIIESSEMASARVDSIEEQKASRFAGDVILGGRAEELAQLCVTEAKGSVERLKSAVVRIAQSQGVPTDALANYLAFRLSLQGLNWWGTANNLQITDTDPWTTARDMCLQYMDLSKLEPFDADLVASALSDGG